MNNLGTDILLERRHEFKVHDALYTLYPPSLGITSMIKASLEGIGIDLQSLATAPAFALLPLIESRPLDCCRIIALATCRGRDEAMSSKVIDTKAKQIHKWLQPDEIMSLLLIAITNNRVGEFLKESGIEKENGRMRRVASFKKNDTPMFGGKTIFGQMLDPVLERYGWTYEYAVWGVSYATLTALMADKVTSIILTDDEKKQVPKRLLETEDAINGDDPKNWAKIKQLMDMQ
jgi:hypothetical protein